MKRIKHYEVRDLIGSEPAGEVFLAFDPVGRRTVMIRTLDRARLPPAEMPDIVARFKEEAAAAGRLTHPNIVTVHECGEDGQVCFIVMEHVSGQTLRRYLTENPTPSRKTLLVMARQLFAALVYAHEHGVLHRDLKPSNVMLMGDPGDRASLQIKIMDFGITRITLAPGSAQRGPAGTPGYMSPEQLRGDSVDGRTDIYALGAIFFEMLTGVATYLGSSAEVLRQVVTNDAPLVRSIRPALPPGLDTVIARALARDPAARYASIRSFREALVTMLMSSAVPDPSFSSTVSLAPVDSPAMPAPAAGLALQDAGREKPRILFLDDEERILAALSALFRLRYEVLVSTDGAQALEIVKTRQPNVIVSDQRMPNMQGIDFLRQARELDPSSVRILLTGYSDLEAIAGSINDGEVFRFINKPWSNAEIKETIAQAVEISLATKEASLAAEPATPEASEACRASEAILVAQKGRELFSSVNDVFGRTRPVCHATNVVSVLQTIEDQEVAILLCDLDEFDDADVMLKMLKQSHPQIQSLGIAASSDSEGLISLINQAQIFRFMNRPLRLGLLDRGIRSALAVYAKYKMRPVLARRQKVQSTPEVEHSSIGSQLLQRLGLFIKQKPASQL